MARDFFSRMSFKILIIGLFLIFGQGGTAHHFNKRRSNKNSENICEKKKDMGESCS